MRESNKKRISVIIPCYCEAGNLEHLHTTLCEVINTMNGFNWRIVFVDDGSNDNSREVLARITESDPRVTALLLSRNFGKESALMAGVKESSRCDGVICMDADLQHPPALLPQLVEKWQDGWQVVATVRESVKSHSIFRKIGSSLYYKLMRSVGGNLLIPNSTDFRLIDRSVLDHLLELNENIRMFRGMIDWFGFPTAVIPFSAPERFHGKANYSYSKLFQLALTSITSFSLWPLRLTGYAGVLIATLSLLTLVISLTLKVTQGEWFITPLGLVILFNTLLVGVLMICLGLIALYIGNIRDSVLGRPDFIVFRRLQKDKKI